MFFYFEHSRFLSSLLILKKLHKYFKSITVAGLPIGSALIGEEKMFKSLFISWIIKLVEIILVVILGYVICLLVGMVTKETSIGIATVSIVFYFFGGLIRPYIKDLQNKITKNLGKNEEN